MEYLRLLKNNSAILKHLYVFIKENQFHWNQEILSDISFHQFRNSIKKFASFVLCAFILVSLLC